VKVRKALNYAINKKAIVESILLGAAEVYDAPTSPVGWGYHKTGTYKYNPKKARKLLAEAGYTKDNKLKIELWSSVGRYTLDTEIAEAIQGQLMNVGIEAKLIKKPDWGAYLFGLRKGSRTMGMTQFGPITGDSDFGLHMLYHSKGPVNWSRYKNSEVDSLLEKARATDDPKIRRKAYARAQEIIFEEAGYVWIYYPKTIYGQRKNVKGVLFIPLEHVLFKNAYKK
jgi:ABC-type transport system substrate-binding protein